ncbi:MAG: hypothetical protein HGB37_01265 [Candidatus Moranbacteria bacterium]|nr:hypothetical protein [Candidatus Moranbacteria bacterium]NTW89528.1 hypothetical protein [Candidatus Moranbacteria bacterium]
MIHIDPNNWPRARANFEKLLSSQFHGYAGIDRKAISLRTCDGITFHASYHDRNDYSAKATVHVKPNGWAYGSITGASAPDARLGGIFRYSYGSACRDVTVLSESRFPWFDLSVAATGSFTCLLIESIGNVLEALNRAVFPARNNVSA